MPGGLACIIEARRDQPPTQAPAGIEIQRHVAVLGTQHLGDRFSAQDALTAKLPIAEYHHHEPAQVLNRGAQRRRRDIPGPDGLLLFAVQVLLRQPGFHVGPEREG